MQLEEELSELHVQLDEQQEATRAETAARESLQEHYSQRVRVLEARFESMRAERDADLKQERERFASAAREHEARLSDFEIQSRNQLYVSCFNYTVNTK